MRRQSPKAAREERQRRVLREALFEARGYMCERCRVERATDMHEVLSRARGGSVLDPDGIKLLCRSCHAWVTTNPDAATAEGLLRARTPEETARAVAPWRAATASTVELDYKHDPIPPEPPDGSVVLTKYGVAIQRFQDLWWTVGLEYGSSWAGLHRLSNMPLTVVYRPDEEPSADLVQLALAVADAWANDPSTDTSVALDEAITALADHL